MMRRLASIRAIVLTLGLFAYSGARADAVLLSCYGTVRLIEENKQVNERGEKRSVAVLSDIANKTLTVDGELWHLAGDTSGDVIVALSASRGSVTLNRVTGAMTLHRVGNGLEIFDGICKPAKKLF